MNNNIKMNFVNTTVAFATTSHNHGNTANTIPTSYLRKNTENAYAKCKADMEIRKPARLYNQSWIFLPNNGCILYEDLI